MTNGKIYYLLETGEVVLHIPENQSEWAKQTTREQDEVLYTPLQAYASNTIGLLELEQGQYGSDFASASGYRVNLNTMELEFTYPIYYPPVTEKLNRLEQENQFLKQENATLKDAVDQLILDSLSI